MKMQLAEILKEVNIAQVFIILAGVWVFYNRLNIKIEKLDDRLSSAIEDVDRRLCRIEGSLSSHGACLFNQAAVEKKAE